MAIARRASVVLLALSPVPALLSLALPAVLVVGSRVADPADATPWLFVAGVAVGVGSAVIGVAGRRHRRRTPGPVPEAPPGGRAGHAAGITALVVVTGAFAGLQWFFSAGARAYVLDPAGPNGCRVVVEEDAFLLTGSGTVYLLRAHDVLAGRVSRYTTDDGYRPVESGSYTLTWTGGQGFLQVSGTGPDPVWPGEHDVDCEG